MSRRSSVAKAPAARSARRRNPARGSRPAASAPPKSPSGSIRTRGAPPEDRESAERPESSSSEAPEAPPPAERDAEEQRGKAREKEKEKEKEKGGERVLGKRGTPEWETPGQQEWEEKNGGPSMKALESGKKHEFAKVTAPSLYDSRVILLKPGNGAPELQRPALRVPGAVTGGVVAAYVRMSLGVEASKRVVVACAGVEVGEITTMDVLVREALGEDENHIELEYRIEP